MWRATSGAHDALMLPFTDFPTARLLADDHTRSLRRSAGRPLFRRTRTSVDQRPARRS